MTLENQLLQKLADWRPDSSSNRLTVDDTGSGWRVTVQADTVDTVGCRLREVGLARLTPLENPVPLVDRANGVAARVTGLLEPLRLVETDSQRGVAQLRSDVPAAKDEALNYYEVLLHDHGGPNVARYEASQGKSRQAIPFTLTHDALGKLVRDLAS
jgi:hypothetical protein